MPIPNVETKHMIEFGDLINFLCESTGDKSYSEIENSLPGYLFESNYHLSVNGVGNSEGDWFTPLGDWMKSVNIKSIYMHHDN